MKSIKINRSTNAGLKQCRGELFEFGGFQFCIANIKEDGVCYAIELSTGMAGAKEYTFFYKHRKVAVRRVKQAIRSRIDLFNADLFDRTERRLSKLSINYPVNKKV